MQIFYEKFGLFDQIQKKWCTFEKFFLLLQCHGAVLWDSGLTKENIEDAERFCKAYIRRRIFELQTYFKEIKH